VPFVFSYDLVAAYGERITVTDWDGFQAQVHPGDGIVARTAGGALVLPQPNAEQQQTVDQLLDLVRDAKPGGGRGLARKLAGILASADSDESLDLALLAPLGGGDVAVLVVGDVEVTADGGEGKVVVSGRDALTWVDRVLRAPTSVIVTAGTGGTAAGAGAALASSDLVAGIVPGGGLSLLPRGAGPVIALPASVDYVKAVATPVAPDPVAVEPVATEPPAPEPVPEPEPAAVPPIVAVVAPAVVPDFEVESLQDPAAEIQRPPLPVDETGVSAGAAQPQIKGVYCKRGHFNDPMAQFCTVCGINMVQQTPALVDGPRPPLGVLVFDDGSVFQLEQDYVLGRQPERAPEVLSGSALPLRLEDTGGTVSRAHALIALEEWTVRLSDHGSANGTYIAMPNSSDWQPVPQNGRVVLVPGTTIKLGNRTLKYESHRGQR
jgi:FHA domain